MVNVKELMIGNLVSDDEGVLAKIIGFAPFEHSIRCDEEEGCQLITDCFHANGKIVSGCCAFSDQSSPIPLTAEWLLEMFGAVPLEIGYRLSERLALCKNLHRDASGDYDGFNVMVKIGLDFRVLVGVPPIRHVHDLQNFYRWHTGEELNVKL